MPDRVASRLGTCRCGECHKLRDRCSGVHILAIDGCSGAPRGGGPTSDDSKNFVQPERPIEPRASDRVLVLRGRIGLRKVIVGAVKTISQYFVVNFRFLTESLIIVGPRPSAVSTVGRPVGI